jgi:hypothetical protein
MVNPSRLRVNLTPNEDAGHARERTAKAETCATTRPRAAGLGRPPLHRGEEGGEGEDGEVNSPLHPQRTVKRRE